IHDGVAVHKNYQIVWVYAVTADGTQYGTDGEALASLILSDNHNFDFGIRRIGCEVLFNMLFIRCVACSDVDPAWDASRPTLFHNACQHFFRGLRLLAECNNHEMQE